MPAQRIGKLALVTLLLFLGACSSTTFLYNRLDFLLPWYLGNYVDLERTQKSLLDELLEPYLRWHRMEELPAYLEVLDQMVVSLDEPLEQEDVAAITLAFEDAWSRLEARGLEWMLELGDSLSDEQILKFLAELDEKQVEYEEEYLTRSEEEFREETYESLRDSFQDFLGKLDSEQLQTLRNTSESMRRSDFAWLDERRKWLENLRAMLQREPGWQQRVRDAVAAREQNTAPEHVEIYEHNKLEIQAAVVVVVNNRSDRQDRRLRKKLNNFRDDLKTLIEQGRK